MINKIFGICMLIGFVLILGTAGNSDLGLISFKTKVIKCLIGLVLIGIGYIGLKLNGSKAVY